MSLGCPTGGGDLNQRVELSLLETKTSLLWRAERRHAVDKGCRKSRRLASVTDFDCFGCMQRSNAKAEQPFDRSAPTFRFLGSPACAYLEPT